MIAWACGRETFTRNIMFDCMIGKSPTGFPQSKECLSSHFGEFLHEKDMSYCILKDSSSRKMTHDLMLVYLPLCLENKE